MGELDRRRDAQHVRRRRRARTRSAAELLRRYGDVMARITLYTPYAIDPDVLATVTAALSAGGAEGS